MIFLITAPVDVNGRHWELDFTFGQATTENSRVADRYKRRGYTVDVLEEDTASENVDSSKNDTPDTAAQPTDEITPAAEIEADNAEDPEGGNSDEEAGDGPCRTSRRKSTKS